MRRSIVIIAGVIAAAIVGSVATIVVRGGSSAPAAPKPPPVSTATVVRTTLADSVLMAGTLGYAATDPLINGLTGTYTQLPSVGTVVSAGQVLYRVDNLPAVLMTGGTPVWRPFAAGMTDGPDVAELQSTLIGLGDAVGLLSTASDHFDWRTVDAIERWQRARRPTRNRPDPIGTGCLSPRGGPCRCRDRRNRPRGSAWRPSLSGHRDGQDGDRPARPRQHPSGERW